MKLQASLAIVLWTCCSSSICFSQDGKSMPDHPLIKNQKGTLSPSSPAASMPVPLYKSLETATTNSQKADIYFLIAKYYAAERLKIDSSLFYIEKIKQQSQAGNYELGMGKYYLSRAFTLYYRG